MWGSALAQRVSETFGSQLLPAPARNDRAKKAGGVVEGITCDQLVRLILAEYEVVGGDADTLPFAKRQLVRSEITEDLDHIPVRMTTFWVHPSLHGSATSIRGSEHADVSFVAGHVARDCGALLYIEPVTDRFPSIPDLRSAAPRGRGRLLRGTPSLSRSIRRGRVSAPNRLAPQHPPGNPVQRATDLLLIGLLLPVSQLLAQPRAEGSGEAIDSSVPDDSMILGPCSRPHGL